jgi:hypothetical protein
MFALGMKNNTLHLWTSDAEAPESYIELPEILGKEVELFLNGQQTQSLIELKQRIIAQTREAEVGALDDMSSAAEWEGMYKREKAEAQTRLEEIQRMRLVVQTYRNENQKMEEILREHNLCAKTGSELEAEAKEMLRKEEEERQRERLS